MKKRRNKVPKTKTKPTISVKDKIEEIAVGIIYKMEIYRDVLALLQRKNKLTRERQFEVSVRIDSYMQILVGVMGLSISYIEEIRKLIKQNLEWWNNEVDIFADRNYGVKKINIVTMREFEHELKYHETRKQLIRKTVSDAKEKNILIKP